MRSLLFVPGDSEKKIPKALVAGADCVILDLEDSVAHDSKLAARRLVSEVLTQERSCKLFVRVNALSTGLTLDDLTAIIDCNPDGLVLPKSESGASVNDLAQIVMAVSPGRFVPPIVAIATETAASLFGLASYVSAHPALYGLTWGMEDLAAALGARSNRDEQGQPTGPYQLARTLCLAGARAAAVEPIDAVYANFRDYQGLLAECRDAARDGFTAKMCIHPDQVGPINEAFAPTPQELAAAQKIVAAFEAAGNKGVLSLDGRMLDAPHLKAARNLLAKAKL
jgi:citrate lyase subunit beta/citryl-CoA lyase